MIIMIASDFYSEYELYKTDDIDGLIEAIRNENTSGFECIGSQDDIYCHDAIKKADRIVFISDVLEGVI